MFLISTVEKIFHTYFLLAATAGLIVLGFLGSVNVLYLTSTPPSFWGWLGLFFYRDGYHAVFGFFLGAIPKAQTCRGFCYGDSIGVPRFAFHLRELNAKILRDSKGVGYLCHLKKMLD